MTKLSNKRTVLVTVFLLVLWNALSWYFTERTYLSDANALIDQETSLAQQRANDLSDSIVRNLNHLHGIPDLLSELVRVKEATTRFGTAATPSLLPLEQRRRLWTADPGLNDLSRYLAVAEKSLNADLIFLLNAAGDCIAASNWNTDGSPVGNNYAERDFFKQNKNSQRGMQYAVGKTTHIAGMYFSTPVIIDGKFMGAMVAKADVPKLSFLTRHLDSFVADTNGVIILARDKELEMLALPDADIGYVSEQARLARYQRSTFPILKIRPWKDPRFPSLTLFQNETVPHVLASYELPEFGLKVYVEGEISAMSSLSQHNFWLTLLLGAFGSLLILAMIGSAIYLQSAKRSREMLWKRANFDALTELPNRDMWRDRLSQEIKKADRSGLPLALLLIDLDQFKEVNDTLGHDMGDLLLQMAAARIVDCVRKSDSVARLGGDEFSVVLPQLADASHVDTIAQKIILKLSEPFQLQDEVVYISASIGITLYPADSDDIDSMMKNADQAMYAAKENGRNRLSHFTASLQEEAQKRLRLTNDLRSALSDNQFRVYFQPIVELATNRVHKAEALIRWLHPVRGMVSPFEFIPLAEKTRLIVDIGAWVRRESIAWCRRWDSLTPDGFQISINKSPVEFMDENDSGSVASFIEDLHESNLLGKNFVFEITEGLLLNADQRINNKLVALRDAGIQVSIDDFGTGYSSLSYLKKFDIDYLKIDQSFVRNLAQESDDMALCEAIIVMAHKLGLKVIAEGVETEQQRDLLLRADCDYAQGYLYSRPVPPEDFEKWLTDRSNSQTQA
ncbi:MAG: EAL domain-containing protein [Gallionella sp.]|jgi:diguanylate cyclase (GGDEF)-like protein